MAFSMMVPAVAGCSRSGKGDVISEDDPWFDLTTIEIGADEDTSGYEYLDHSYLGISGDNFAFQTQGLLKLPSDFDWDRDNYSDYMVGSIDIYDKDGALVNSVDVMELMRSNGFEENSYINSMGKIGDDFYVNVSCYDSRTYEEIGIFRSIIDGQTGEAGEFVESTADSEYQDILDEADASDEGLMYAGDYTVQKFWIYGEDKCSYILIVTDSEGETTLIDLRDELPSVGIWDIANVIDIGGDRGLICGSQDGGEVYLILDFNDMSVSEVDDDMSWLSGSVYDLVSVEGLGTVVSDQDGISVVDYDNKTIETVFSFGDSNVNRYDVNNLSPVSVNEDQIIMVGSIWRPSINQGDYNNSTYIMVFDRAETNPNAGKSVVNVAALEGYSAVLCDAVCEFNGTSDDYFIRLVSTYDSKNFYNYDEIDENTDYEELHDSVTAAIGNQLAIDVMSGDGPDVIIDGAIYSQLDNDNYLMDLSDLIEELGSDNYFTNIFEASKVNDGLYQVPLSFSIQGIVTDKTNVDNGQIGFTYEQYDEFVDEVCNGTAPIRGGKMSLFLQSLNIMQDLMIEDGRVNYDNDAFRALAEYVAENVNEDLTSDDDYVVYDSYYGGEEDSPASTAYISDIASYYDQTQNGRRVILGYPTYDGRGPIVYSLSSVAISAQTSHPDACREFASLLLGDEYQEAYGARYGIPVNREAFEADGLLYIEEYNRQLQEWYSDMSAQEMRINGINPDPMDEDCIDEFTEMVEQLNGWYTNDGAINSIIREEMPAFFEGQKSLDQIIPVLEDRVQTVLDERA